MNDRTYRITDFGASTDDTDNASHIQKAIDSMTDGGTLIIPKGEYVTGAFRLRSNIHIYIEAGAVLKAHGDISKYVKNGYFDSFGKETDSFITAFDCENITISGEGEIDMQGHLFVEYSSDEEAPATPLERPKRPILFSGCKNIDIRNIKLKDAPCWTITFHDSENIKVRSVTVANDQRIPHNDGLHFTACRNVIVNDCDFACGDDCIAITSLFDYSLPSDGIIISNCHMSSRSSAIRVGHIASKIKNVLVSNIIIKNTNRGIAVFAGNNGSVENVHFSNIISETRLFNGAWWGKGEPIVLCTYASSGKIKSIAFDNICAKAENPVIVAGDDISDISFRDCSFNIETARYTSDTYELSPNGLAPKSYDSSPIANLAGIKLSIK